MFVKVHKDVRLKKKNEGWIRGRLRGNGEGMNDDMKIQDSRMEEVCVCLSVCVSGIKQ